MAAWRVRHHAQEAEAHRPAAQSRHPVMEQRSARRHNIPLCSAAWKDSRDPSPTRRVVGGSSQEPGKPRFDSGRAEDRGATTRPPALLAS